MSIDQLIRSLAEETGLHELRLDEYGSVSIKLESFVTAYSEDIEMQSLVAALTGTEHAWQANLAAIETPMLGSAQEAVDLTAEMFERDGVLAAVRA